jgi:hypothetical protein
VPVSVSFDEGERDIMRRRAWLLLGLVAGGLLGVAVVAFGTHGSASESETERHAEHSLFWVRLYDERGSPESVRAVERNWGACVFTGGAILGGVIGLAVAFRRTRRCT